MFTTLFEENWWNRLLFLRVVTAELGQLRHEFDSFLSQQSNVTANYYIDTLFRELDNDDGYVIGGGGILK